MDKSYFHLNHERDVRIGGEIAGDRFFFPLNQDIVGQIFFSKIKIL